jgi:hypothetical protein
MDFNKLMQTMRDLDQPSVESQVADSQLSLMNAVIWDQWAECRHRWASQTRLHRV